MRRNLKLYLTFFKIPFDTLHVCLKFNVYRSTNALRNKEIYRSKSKKKTLENIITIVGSRQTLTNDRVIVLV